MQTTGLAAVVLAAGLGKRMQSDLPKVLHRAHGRPLIEWVLDAVRDVGIERIIVIIGHQADRVPGRTVGRQRALITGAARDVVEGGGVESLACQRLVVVQVDRRRGGRAVHVSAHWRSRL